MKLVPNGWDEKSLTAYVNDARRREAAAIGASMEGRNRALPKRQSGRRLGWIARSTYFGNRRID